MKRYILTQECDSLLEAKTKIECVKAYAETEDYPRAEVIMAMLGYQPADVCSSCGDVVGLDNGITDNEGVRLCEECIEER